LFEVAVGRSEAIPVKTMDQIKMAENQKGQYFIVGGLVDSVAEVREDFKTGCDRRDSRLHVITTTGPNATY
jgi:hypothetical protein